MEEPDPFKFGYTIEDYKHWPPNDELLHGCRVVRESPSYFHQSFAGLLYSMIREQLDQQGRRLHCVQDCDWQIDFCTSPRPDLSVVDKRPTGRCMVDPPLLCIEVLSPSTASTDMLQKRRTYAEAGLPWYIIANPKSYHLTLLRLEDGRYVEQPPEADALAIPLLEDQELHFDLTELSNWSGW